MLKIPIAPNSIQKGVPLKLLLDEEAITQLAQNINFVYPAFNPSSFISETLKGAGRFKLERKKFSHCQVIEGFFTSCLLRSD